MYGIEHKLLAILYSLLMLLCALGVRLTAGTFLVPAGVFALAWFAYTFFPLVLLFNVPINSWAVLYMTVAVAVVALSAVPFKWKHARVCNLQKSLPSAGFESQFFERTLYVSVVVSAVLSLATMVINGWTVQDIIFGLLETSGEFAAQRGTEGMEYGLIGLLGVFFTYLCPVLAGLRATGPQQRRYLLIGLAPCLFTMVIQSTKLVFLVGVAFYLSSALLAKIYANQLELPSLSRLPRYILMGIGFAALVLVSFVSREGMYELEFGDLLEPLAFALASYLLGQIYAFSDFFSYTIGMPGPTTFAEDYYSLGAYSFASVFDMLGIGKEFPPGMYAESGGFSEVFETNLFTVFRGLIYDFGVPGSLIFLFLFGLVVHAVTYRVFTRKDAWLACVTYIAATVFIIMGYLYSVFVARYVLLNAVAVWMLLRLNQPGAPSRQDALAGERHQVKEASR
jgi:oligosaccharide repeat unit polymerase